MLHRAAAAANPHTKHPAALRILAQTISKHTSNSDDDTGVCEMNTHLDVAGVSNVPNPLL